MPELTNELARAAATDAGNRAMRKGGRTVWSEDDYNAAVAEYYRLWPDPIREATRNLISASDDLTSAIEGATDQFDTEKERLMSATSAAEEILWLERTGQ